MFFLKVFKTSFQKKKHLFFVKFASKYISHAPNYITVCIINLMIGSGLDNYETDVIII